MTDKELPGRREGVRREPPLFTKLYDIAKWLMGRVESFPKVMRFSVGTRIMDCALAILEDVTRAQFRKAKVDLLASCNERLDVLRVLLRLAMEGKGLSFRQYELARWGRLAAV